MQYDAELKSTVRGLGELLGQTIQKDLGQEWLDKIEHVRKLGRKGHKGDVNANTDLAAIFASMSDDDLMVIARSFSQFLNLANIAEQEFNASQQIDDSVDTLFEHLKKSQKSPEDIYQAVNELHIDLVLTAHPTEVTRRTLIHKHAMLAECIRRQNREQLNEQEKRQLAHRVADLVAQAWHTEEIRNQRPTPVDEATWGFSVIENSLWDAIPNFMRDLDLRLQHEYQIKLPIDAKPVQISSWMGGDRDGNPFVTHQVTQTVLHLARRRAAKLFAQDISTLQVELSMSRCSDEIRHKVGDVMEPYRAILRPLVKRLRATKDGIDDILNDRPTNPEKWIQNQAELIEPLMLCYRSLVQSGMSQIANGALLDTIRRAHCFGMHLIKLDIRQDSERHANAIAEVCQYLGYGDYAQWTEDEKVSFLLKELQSKRPLFPNAWQTDWQPSAEVKEVLDTCHTIAKNDANAFGIYIISMASYASDVLAVQLLLQQCRVNWQMPVAPLFETLDDLNRSAQVIEQLLKIDGYRKRLTSNQYIMIGYSDSAKDAGALAAGWAQYQAQEALVNVTREANVGLTLFHGRGGTIGRGGLPSHTAILSQPPGSLDGGFRITEQGETIRYKFGMSAIAKRSLGIYASAIIEAKLFPPPQPKSEWRAVMTQMADYGRDNYRDIVRNDPEFVPYFRQATPEQELGKLPLGSRPAKRNPHGGVESLRAIPWIFAWAQTRLVLPAWLGVMPAIMQTYEEHAETINEMLATWPFFASRLSMLDMVFAKADMHIAKAYDERLVEDKLRHFGDKLRAELTFSREKLLELTQKADVLQDDPVGANSLHIRADYLQPLHYLQIELLDRIRKNEAIDGMSPAERAMMVTIAGIAIGIRNTG
ncbi:phosphoenolpyruvate carboxylase [Alteromonas sp. LMIT006]|uniref:phosphoenolpyruvate carboxylase n=1 Tax=Alteromonadaceae TaxID=72275 RepID=UPI0020CA63C5|nr:phosphoenolpyruvate carboxylase [Alteromonas sp. LMIT006]UTP72863.1 phosphoenolpyruvate carboxylase [Alteromonas sp. LMIT006]